MKRSLFIVATFLLTLAPAFGQRPDFSGLKFCIDPGHGGYNSDDRHVVPDPGIDFWESESNFQKALLLKTLLEQEGAWVVLTRTSNDTTYPGGDDEPSLTARVQVANENDVDWFHSIHSNAFDGLTNYTLLLVREKRSPTDPAASTGNGLGVPELQGSWDVSSGYISPGIYNKLRTSQYLTYLDWTFYGGVNGGFSLGVLRGLIMPGELSEGSFHDYLPETRRLMNNDYRKMEAYAIRDAFMQYFNTPPDPDAIIAGIQRNISTHTPINYTQVQLLPEGKVYHGDQDNNGFYMFDQISAGPHIVRFETPGFAVDSMSILVGSGSTNFVDRSLVSLGLPTVVQSSPVANDTAFPASLPLRLVFSTVMDTASVRNAFSLSPPVAGTFVWSNGNTTCLFYPLSLLPFYVNYTVAVDTTAHSVSGSPLDGNGDGIPGDAFVLHFRTTAVDVVPPRLVEASPDSIRGLATPGSVVEMTFDEVVNPATVTISNFAIQRVGGSLLGRSLQTFQAGGRSGVTMFLNSDLVPGASYRVRISGVKDMAGNAIPPISPVIWTFSVAPGIYSTTTVDSLDGPLSAWTAPLSDPNSKGLDSATFAFSPSVSVQAVAGDRGSGVLKYMWDTSATSWLLAEALDSTHALSQPVWVKSGSILRAYLLGDGSGAQFRFVVDDSVEAFPGGDPAHQEVSPWVTISWIGWRMVEWDLAHDSVGSWAGNGILEGNLRFRGVHLRYLPGMSEVSGTLVIDQIEVVDRQPLSVSEGTAARPLSFALYPAFPNPFNPSTQIRFEVPAKGHVSMRVYDLLGREVRTLVESTVEPGKYEATWNATDTEGRSVATGVYFVRLHVVSPQSGSDFTRTIKLLLTR